MVAQIDLPRVVPTLEIAGFVSGRREGRKEHCGQDGQDDDHDQQLDERETAGRTPPNVRAA